ncbi:MAG: hypothetical protein WC897_02975 [Candidatus Gracilibacteria bacterium]
MDKMNLIIGIILLIGLAVFAFYGLLAIRHAARFRYLSKRTLYLTLFFTFASAILIVLSLIAYTMLIVN